MNKDHLTIKDIAKKSGVSVATVSRVISNKGNVKTNTRKRIEAVMETEGYVPNMLARGMSQKKTKTVGILAPVLINTVHVRYMSMLEHELRDNDFNTLIICNTGYEADKTPFLEELLGRMVDAILILGCSMVEHLDPKAFGIAASRIPVMVINGGAPADNVYSIYCDERDAIRKITLSLLDKGKKQILYIYDTATFSGDQKISGYREAFAARGIEVDTQLLLCHIAGTNIRSTARVGVRNLVDETLKKYISFDAVVAADDILAVGAIEALRNHGIRTGQEMPVIGFNNDAVAECTYPKLSSVDTLPEEMCSLAISHLLGVIEGKRSATKIVTPYKIIERESSGNLLLEICDNKK